MGIASKAVWTLLLVGGVCVFVVGIVLAVRQSQDQIPTSARLEGRKRSFAFGTGSRGFALLIVGAGLMLFCLMASGTVWEADGRSTSAATTTPAVLESGVTRAPGPTSAVPTPLPSAVPRNTTAASKSAPTGRSVPCDGSWATSLGSTRGEVKAPTQFLRDMRALRGDESLRMIETSNECASITPGIFQVIGGIHATGEDALAECAARSLTSRSDCFAEILTENPADRVRRMYPD